MSYIPGQPVTAVVQRVEIHKLRQGENLILGFSIGGGIDQDPSQNPFSEDKTDKGIYVTRISEGGPAEIAGLQIGDKIMQGGAELGHRPNAQSCKSCHRLLELSHWTLSERARREKSRGGKSEPMLPTASLECLPSY
ncbi:tax1-binding protein 3 isoform X1 [Ailuropoda melanoleuca]|uniref:tax1-binding protein 3 isoform X1 n=1 Tax=Ailuropoda melanoleuca TaxID=9646 RepID=UPI0014944CC7|nr:tax1-binding protein 3 isoform X1 [Ailuropoda melanoleuca]